MTSLFLPFVLHLILWLYVCMHARMYVCMFVCLIVWLFVCLSAFMDVWLLECLSVCMYICMSTCMSVCPSVRSYACLSVCLSVCIYVVYAGIYVCKFMFVRMCVYVSISNDPLQGVPKKCNPPLFAIYFQNSNIIMASWLHRRSKGYPVEVSSKSVLPSQSCDVKLDPFIISLQRNVKPMVKTGFSCRLAREPEQNAKNSLVSNSACRFALDIYLVLEWNDRGVKLCLTALTGMDGFASNCNRLSLQYPSI